MEALKGLRGPCATRSIRGSSSGRSLRLVTRSAKRSKGGGKAGPTGGFSDKALAQMQEMKRRTAELDAKLERSKPRKAAPTPAYEDESPFVQGGLRRPPPPSDPASAPPPPQAAPPAQGSDTVPQVVTDRMLRRVFGFTGVPVFFGFCSMPAFYYVKKVMDPPLDVPNVVALGSISFFFGLAALGITYGVLSASYDPNEEGSALGLKEFKDNLPSFLDRVPFLKAPKDQ